MEDLNTVKGIGPKSLASLNKLGINNINDLLTYYPYRYDTFERSNIEEILDGDRIVIDGKVESLPIILHFNKGLNKMNFRLVTTTNKVLGVSIFNRSYLKKNLTIGTNVIVIGKFDKTKNVVTASDVKIGLLGNTCKIEPVYRLTSGLTSKNLSTYINLALLTNGRNVMDYIPEYLIEKYNFVNKKTCLNIIHNPSDFDKLNNVINRLKYEELFSFMVKINYLKEINKKSNGLIRDFDINIINDYINDLPFKLTGDQTNAINKILDSFKSNKRLNTLLQGDVGSGKTIVSIIAMYANTISGYQSALMAPTEILATQHYNNLVKSLGDKARIGLLIGSLTKKEKDKITEDLRLGNIDIIVGTHALIQQDVVYNNLGLVVTDEQHRFGVNQRANLKNKGIMPDVIYMSATPIPRTFALTIYGDMDVITIKEMPKGRSPVKTICMNDEEIPKVLELMYNELKLSHQIYVIAPLIEDSENSELISVNDLCDKMNLAFGSKYKIEVMHGKLSNVLKDNIMERFKNNETNILISTTVVEVGVDVPNASMIVIFDAYMFGLSTLHQLRGRVGRSDIKSSCILISSKETERLHILEKTTDGFLVAENDFKLRGSGDLFGTKQSGDMNFKIANIREDYEILLKANEDSKEFLTKTDAEVLMLRNKIINTVDTD